MRKSLILLFAASLLVMSGCASKYGEQRTTVNYYPACYKPINDLRENEHNVAKSTATGAVVGAASGALIGLLTTGDWRGALMGAAVGGVGGTMVGNMYGRKQQEKDDNIRLASYLQDIDGDISNLDVTSAAARSSLQCYDREFQALLSSIRARQISREAAQQRFTEIQNGREEAIAILGNVVTQGTSLDREYEQAFASEQQQIDSPQAMAQGRAAYQQKARTLNTARQKKRAITRKVEEVRSERIQAQNTSSSQSREIQEAMAQLRELKA